MNYENYKGLLIQLARKFSKKPEDFDDLMGICHEAYCKAVLNYQPEKGKFVTLLYHYANRALIDEYRKKKTRQEKIGTMPLDYIMDVSETGDALEFEKLLIDEKQDIERRLDFKIQLENVSQEAKEMISMILNSPYELFESTKSLSPKYLRGEVIRMLRRRKWKWETIHQSIKEIKNVLQNFK